MTVTVDEVVAAYVKLRNKRDALKKEMEARIDEIKSKMSKLEAWVKETADAQGVTSFKTKHGTAFLTTTDYAQVANWDALLEHILENESYDMFEKRVSKLAVRGYIEAHKTVPPGVNYGTRIEVQVRKPSARDD
jgi:prophage tail gpP-like protein